MTLGLLCMAPSFERPSGLPSCCPSFHSDPLQIALLFVFSGFRAGSRDSDPKQSKIKASDTGNAIMVPGFRLDAGRNVADLSYTPDVLPDLSDDLGPDGAAARNLQWETSCIQLFQEVYHSSSSSSEGLEIHARTLIANHLEVHNPISSNMSVSADYLLLKKFWALRSGPF